MLKNAIRKANERKERRIVEEVLSEEGGGASADKE